MRKFTIDGTGYPSTKIPWNPWNIHGFMSMVNVHGVFGLIIKYIQEKVYN